MKRCGTRAGHKRSVQSVNAESQLSLRQAFGVPWPPISNRELPELESR